jgi:hypothetical protein
MCLSEAGLAQAKIPPRVNKKFPLPLKRDQLSKNFFTINDTIFIDNVMKTGIGVTFKTVLFTLLYNVFR